MQQDLDSYGIVVLKMPSTLEFSADGRHLFFTEATINAILVLDPLTDKITSRIAVGASPHYANFTRDGLYGLAVSQDSNELAIFSPGRQSRTPYPDYG